MQVSAESRAAVLEFIERRLEQLLADGGVQVGWDGDRSEGQWDGTLRSGTFQQTEVCLPPQIRGVQIEAVRAALRERGSNPALAARTAREIAVSASPCSCCRVPLPTLGLLECGHPSCPTAVPPNLLPANNPAG